MTTNAAVTNTAANDTRNEDLEYAEWAKNRTWSAPRVVVQPPVWYVARLTGTFPARKAA